MPVLWVPRRWVVVAGAVVAMLVGLLTPPVGATLSATSRGPDTPVVTKVSPHAGPQAGGTTVTIRGARLADTTRVRFGGRSASFTVVSDTEVTAVSPPSFVPGPRKVRVWSSDGLRSRASEHAVFTYRNDPRPVVTRISPRAGIPGTTVTITGTGFSRTDVAEGVQFGSMFAEYINVDSDTQITAVAPRQDGPGPVDVHVTNHDGATSRPSRASTFTYEPVPVPSVTSLSPRSGPRSGGTTVVITGTGFTATAGVFFGWATAMSFTVDSDTQITAVTGGWDTPTTVDVVVQNAYFVDSPPSRAARFTYTKDG